jgi:predicted membrane protein
MKKKERSRILFILLGLVLVFAIGYFDVVTGPEYSVCLFYLIPIVLITWYTNRWIGAIISIASATIIFIADTMTGSGYSKWIIPYWNAGIRLGFFLVTTFLLAALKKALDNEKAMSRLDSLTGALNGKYFTEVAKDEITRILKIHTPPQLDKDVKQQLTRIVGKADIELQGQKQFK